MSWGCCKCFKAESTDIKQLNYEHYTLHDVPTEVFVFERTLEELHLDSNRIRDLPRPLFHCHGLKILSLSDNEVHSLPPAIASLINLQHLDVSRNALNSIPDNLKGCKHLTYVDVSVNPLEKLPEGFTQLISLEELYLNDTYLDFLPANFGRLMRLKILELRENNLNTLPKSIARLVHLQRLDIGQNDFSDVPEVIGNLPNLTELWIDSNRIRFIPLFIGNLKKLVHLEASNNNIQFVSPEIENCLKLVDLSLTCNELKTLPENIGNLKELITLKVDDNQLSVLPSTVGNLSNLEELILSQNDLEALPASIGLLRKLHILNVDDNMLEELPPEIGSCSGLTILSAHSNKLLHVPAEIGHLSNLHVINLSENQLQNLPVSILNLGQLSALWLSNNQSTPLTTLQQEIDKHSGQMVCTNFMLPQSSQEVNPIKNNWLLQNVYSEQPNKTKPHISFANDAEAEAPSRLMRAPTPYPKELRAMAKHARAIRNLKKTKELDYDSSIVEEMVSQEPKDVLIKEAKVKKPSIDPVTVQATEYIYFEKNMGAFEEHLESKRYLDSNSILQVYESATYSSSMAEPSPVIALDAGPVVREAKYVRKSNIPNSPLGCSVPENTKRQSYVSNPEQTQQNPPPYHIAAAYSKQAAYFLQNSSKQIPRITNCNDENGSSSPQIGGRGQKAGQIDLDVVSNISEEERMQRSLEYIANNDKLLILHENDVSSISQEGSIHRSLEYAANNDKILENNVISNISQEGRIRGSFEGTGNNRKIVISPENKLFDHFSDHSLSPEELPSEENISDECSLLSLPGKLYTDSCISERIVAHEEISSLENKNNLNDISSVSDQHSIENNYKKTIQLEERNETSVESVTLNLLNLDSCERTDEEICDTPLQQKPQTFTQDKPVVSESVIAPTPQRPRSVSLGTTNSPSPDLRMSSLPTDHLVTSAKKELSAIPPFIPFSRASLYEQTQTESKVSCSSNSLLLNVGNEKLHENFSSPSLQKIPTVFIPSSKIENVDVQRNASSVYNLPLEAKDNSFIYNDTRDVNTHDFYDSVKGQTEDNDCKEQCQPSFQESSVNSSYPEEHLLIDINTYRDLSNQNSEIPSMEHSVNLSENSEVVPDLNSSDNFSAEQRNKSLVKWMFGLHKNATVFPVTIQKNSGLGFSISGGMKTISNGERYENEIIVTKVHPHGPANKIIRPGDKILEVDGIDFTKLEHEAAVTVLKKTGNVVCMMISRQQL